MNLKDLLARAHRLPPHILYPAILLVLALLLVLARAALDRPAAPSARAPAPVAVAGPAATRPGTRVAPASAQAAPAASAPASAASVTVAAAVPVLPPKGATAGYVHEVAQGQDQFGAWITTHDSVPHVPLLKLTIPTPLPGSGGTNATNKYTYSGWLDLAAPVATVTLRSSGGSGDVTFTAGGGEVLLRAPSGMPGVAQAALQLAAGWHKFQLTVTRKSYNGVPLQLEVQLGTATTNPVIAVPYWTPAAVPAAPASVPASASSVPAPTASKAPAPKATTDAAAHAAAAARPRGSAAMKPAASKIKDANLGHSVPGSAGGARSKGAAAGAKP